MQIEDLATLVGEIVLLDLVSGMQIATKVTGVDPAENKVNVERPVLFQIQAAPPAAPGQPPQQQLACVNYGGPFAIQRDDHSFDASHVINAHKMVADIEKAYIQATSNIQIAGAETLAGLPAANR